MFSPLEWENYFERKIRHNLYKLCSGHLLTLWGDPLRHGGLICNMHGTEVSSGLSDHDLGPRNSICMSGHKTFPVLLGLYNLSSVLFWFFLSVWRRKKKRKMLVRTTTLEAEGLPAVGLVLAGKQMMIWKCVPCLVPAFRTLQAPIHNFSNCTFRTLVLSSSYKSFENQFVSDETILCILPVWFSIRSIAGWCQELLQSHTLKVA